MSPGSFSALPGKLYLPDLPRCERATLAGMMPRKVSGLCYAVKRSLAGSWFQSAALAWVETLMKSRWTEVPCTGTAVKVTTETNITLNVPFARNSECGGCVRAAGVQASDPTAVQLAVALPGGTQPSVRTRRGHTGTHLLGEPQNSLAVASALTVAQGMPGASAETVGLPPSQHALRQHPATHPPAPTRTLDAATVAALSAHAGARIYRP